MRRLRLLGGHWSRGSTSHVMRIFGSDWIEKSHQRIKLAPLFGRLLVFAFSELIFLFKYLGAPPLKILKFKVKYHVIINVIWHSPLRKWLCKWKNGVISEKTSAWWVFPQQNHTPCSPTRVEINESVGHSVAYANSIWIKNLDSDRKSEFGPKSEY